MSSLLITLVNTKGKSHKSENSLKPIQKKKTPTSYFLVKNQKKYNRAKNDLMNYLIDEQAKYTNLDKASEFYQNQIEEYRRKMNKNEEIIEKKKKILDSMNIQFSELLMKNMQYLDNGKIEGIEKEKSIIENEIETLTQALEMYKNIKTELQIEKINLKKNLKVEYIESLKRKQQYDKYAVIKTKIENEEKAQDKLYHTMENFNIKAKNLFNEKENKKKNILAKEEFSLNELKQSMQNAEEFLNKLEKKISKKKKILPFEKSKNEKILQDVQLIRKECISSFLKVNLIKKIYKLKDLDELVHLIKKQNMQFNTKYNNLNNMLSDLTNLNIEDTNKIKEMKLLKKQIKEKLESIMIYDEPELINKIVLINGTKQENIFVKEKADKKENIIKEIIRFIDLYYPQFEKMLKSVLLFNLKIKEKSMNKNNLESVIKLFDNKENFKEIKKYCSTKNYTKEDYKIVIKLMLQFFRKFNYLYNNFIIDIAIQASKNNNNDNEITIFIYSKLSKEIEEEEKEKIFEKREKLLKNIRKKDDNQLKNALIKENITKEISNVLGQGIDIEQLLINYIHILRERNENKNKVKEKDSFEYESYKEKKRNDKKRKKYNEEEEKINEIQNLFIRLKMKFFIDISKYTSDLVKHEDWDKKNKNKYNNEIKLYKKKQNKKKININELLGDYQLKIKQNIMMNIENIPNKKEEKENDIFANKFEKKEKESNEKKNDSQISDNTFSDENEYNKHPDIEKEKKIIKTQKYYYGYNYNPEEKVETEYSKMLNLHKINIELFHKKATFENFQDYDSLQNEFQRKLNMKIYSPIIDYFSPKRDYSNANKTAKNFYHKNDKNIKTTPNFNQKNNGKQDEKYPKILSGKVSIGN